MTRIIHPQRNDLDRVFQFVIACDIEEFGEADTSCEDFEQQWEEADLDRDVWIAIDEQENILAYAAVSFVNTRYTVELYLSGTLTPIELDRELVKNCLDRVDGIVLGHQDEKATVVGYSSASNARLCQLFKRSGFQEKTYHFRMQTDFDGIVEKPAWSPAYKLDAYTSNDEQELYQLITKAFDWEGHITPSLESWRWLVLS